MFDIMLEISKTSLQVLGSEIFNQITKSKYSGSRICAAHLNVC